MPLDLRQQPADHGLAITAAWKQKVAAVPASALYMLDNFSNAGDLRDWTCLARMGEARIGKCL
jgi:hypothetical protein